MLNNCEMNKKFLSFQLKNREQFGEIIFLNSLENNNFERYSLIFQIQYRCLLKMIGRMKNFFYN
jgi:hypothetical protein